MIGIDFRDRGTGEELEGFLKQVLERGKAFRMGILLIGALLAFVGVESLRLAGAMHNVRELEQRRDSLAFDVQRMQARVRAVRVRRTALLSAIERRRSNFDFARKIGAAGDMLAT
ncbi:MAG TPA: hypothetical protein VMD07_08770, partial [Candidatus Acidoferrales bacterium]|nr:hypothetical protein [Candidatus Acidoferrales bacterium]